MGQSPTSTTKGYQLSSRKSRMLQGPPALGTFCEPLIYLVVSNEDKDTFATFSKLNCPPKLSCGITRSITDTNDYYQIGLSHGSNTEVHGFPYPCFIREIRGQKLRALTFTARPSHKNTGPSAANSGPAFSISIARQASRFLCLHGDLDLRLSRSSVKLIVGRARGIVTSKTTVP